MTADLLDRQHVDAGLDLLRADSGLVVYPDAEGLIPDAADRANEYVLVYATITRPRSAPNNAINGKSTSWTTTWYTHAVGPNAYASQAVAMRVNRALADQLPTIAGRSVNPITQSVENPPAPTRDENTGVTVFDAVVLYEMVTGP